MQHWQRVSCEPVQQGSARGDFSGTRKCGRSTRGARLARAASCLILSGTVLFFASLPVRAQIPAANENSRLAAGIAASPNAIRPSNRPENVPPQRLNVPPRVLQAQRFLARRGLILGAPKGPANWRLTAREISAARPQVQSPGTNTWQSLGPDAVLTLAYGMVTGRVSALALDPADATGNHLYIGTTGGGVWVAQNAAVSNASQVVFTPLTDAVGALSGAINASISIGALTVQPDGTGVILAGTGDPNDALDSYYGAGIPRPQL
jgi:hypothetical protein